MVLGPGCRPIDHRPCAQGRRTDRAHQRGPHPVPGAGPPAGPRFGRGAVAQQQAGCTLARTEQFGLGFTNVGVPGSLVTFGIYDQVALLPHRLLQQLPEIARQHHAAAVVRVNQALAEHGLPVLRSALPPAWQAPERPAATPSGSSPAVPPAGAERPMHAVTPTARLDAIATTAHAPLEQSL
ncbi:MAG: hypothetical protein ACRDZ0_02420 [Acidimicrobiales bacterium]